MIGEDGVRRSKSGRRLGGAALGGHKNPRAKMNGLKHGRNARSCSPKEIREGLLRKIHPEAPEILDRIFAEAAGTGELSELNQVGARAQFDLEILRRASVATIVADGVTIKDTLMDKEGNVYGHRLKAHPLMPFVLKSMQNLGFTAEDMEQTNRAKGQGAKDAAMTAALDRMALLRSAPKDRMLPPAEKPAIEATAVSVSGR